MTKALNRKIKLQKYNKNSFKNNKTPDYKACDRGLFFFAKIKIETLFLMKMIKVFLFQKKYCAK